MPYPAQLERKRRHLETLLRASLGKKAPAVEPMLGLRVDADGMPWRFRRKAAFVFAEGPRTGRRRGALVMGHFARASAAVVAVEECPVHGDRANRLAFALFRHLARAGIPHAGPRLDGILRHVLVRTSHDEGEAVVMLVVTRNDKSLRTPVRAFLSSPDRPDGFLINVNDRPGPFMVGRETIRVDGVRHVHETVLGTRFLVSPDAFFQTSPEGATLLVDEVRTCAAASPRSARERGSARAPGTPPLSVLDLYAGSGLFAVPLASAGHRVTAVEENEQAVADLEANRRLNGLPRDRIQVMRGRVEDMLPKLTRRAADLVVLDPPRQGCPPRVLDGVFRMIAPPRVAHVSCNPEALARELAAIVAAGYRVDRVQPVDMFPHTPHIESVVTLQAPYADPS